MTWGFSQTPGIIIRDGANNIPPLSKSLVLDPNQDGYVSQTNSGYTTSDTGTANEIPYIGISLISNEPSGDIQRGPTGGFSDFVSDVNGKSLYHYFDGTNLLFRLRVGNIVAGAKAYSILIDSDGLFGTADPTYTANNPGFEYEVVVQTGFKIAVYNVNNNTCTSVWERDLQINSQYYHTAIAATNNDSTPDYFLDFYVPLSAFSGAGTVNSTTPLRYQIASVMAPQPALCGPVSDMYPLDNVAAQPACTPDQVANGTCPTQPCTSAPTVNSVTTGATSITGTWTKSSYSTQNTAVIEVFVNGVSAGTVNAISGTPWTLATTAVADGAIIYATALATNETQCNTSNRVKAQSCTPLTTSACPTITCLTSKGMQATGVPGAIITVYKLEADGTSVAKYSAAADSSGNWTWNGGSGGGNANVCGTGANNSVAPGTYYLVQQEPGKCPSACSNYTCLGATSTATPTISTNPITTRTNTITGTAPTDALVRLMLNNIQVASATAVSGIYTFNNVTNYYAQEGNVFMVIAQSTGLCASTASRTVMCEVAAPTINYTGTNSVAAGSQLSGKSTEIGGTVNVYNASNTLIGSTTVPTSGNWTLSTPTVVAGTSYYATVSSACGTSGNSNTVLGTTATSTARCGTITGPVAENATTVSGTITTAVTGTIVTLYIDTFPIGSVTTNNTVWSLPVNTNISNNIYAGGILSIGIQETGKTEVLCPNTITVTCSGPSIPLTNTTTYSGSQSSPVNVTITNSEPNVLYTIEKLDGSDYSASAFGNGGSIVLTTYSLDFTGSQNFYVRAVSLRSTICSSSSAAFIINSSANTACYKPAQSTGTAQKSIMGITALGRAGAETSNWPTVRNGAWTVLEAKTKGFVINRLTNAQVAALPSADLREGMMVYNITLDCLQINTDGTATGWMCYNTQACPD